jgi:hypothetical protein
VDPHLQRRQHPLRVHLAHQAVLEGGGDIEDTMGEVARLEADLVAGQQVANGGDQLLEGEACVAHDRVVRRRQRGQAGAQLGAHGVADHHPEEPADGRRAAGRRIIDAVIRREGPARLLRRVDGQQPRPLDDRGQADPLRL